MAKIPYCLSYIASDHYTILSS